MPCADARALKETYSAHLKRLENETKRGELAPVVAMAVSMEREYGTVRERLAAAAGRGRLDRLGDGVAALLGRVLDRVPAVLAEVGEGARRVAREVGERAWRLARRRDDDGAVLMADVDARARAVLERHADALARAPEAVERDAGRGLVDAAATLSGAALLVEAHDPSAVLARGFVLVSNGAGRVLTSRAKAAGEARLVLTFGDGTLAAMPTGAGWAGRAAGGRGGGQVN